MSGLFHSLKFHMHLSSDYYLPGGSVVKNLPANAGDTKDVSLIPGSGRSPGGGHGNPFQTRSGESYRQRSLVGYIPWGYKELDTIEMT